MSAARTGGHASDLECISDAKTAECLLHPLRLEIVALAREPASSTEIARRLRLPRQRVNYHVRLLAGRGLLRRAGKRRRRNMVEQRYVSASDGYLLSPGVLGAVAADWRRIADAASGSYLLAVGAQMISDVARAMEAGAVRDEVVSTLSLKSQFRFERPEQRAEFARVLREAVVRAIARYTSPDAAPGEEAPGRPYRLVLGCYPYEPETPRG